MILEVSSDDYAAFDPLQEHVKEENYSRAKFDEFDRDNQEDVKEFADFHHRHFARHSTDSYEF